MLSLPFEVQLDVLKCLKFEQLFSFKQTNFYYRNLIEKYEGELARIDTLSIGRQLRNTHKIVELEPVVSDFALNGQLMKKWKAAIAESVPLFLRGHDDFVGDFVVQMEKTENKKPVYILHLPNIPKTVEELIIVRFWLEQLFNCAFENAIFMSTFNPTMINLLFDDYKAISFQFNIQTVSIRTSNATFENSLKFGLNRFAIYEFFGIFKYEDISEQQTSILFNIIANEGKKLPHVFFGYCDTSRLYDLIIKYITTSKDFSKMVPTICLLYNSLENFKLNVNAKCSVTKQINGCNSTIYLIVNIYNPKTKFLLYKNEKPASVVIKKLEE
ncbi:unnamed protein product [Meloidogyne enterolobii]|uniref:Uncharacterized protein n=1 Tax=Meloidogyne enterolobii TaxID=390850 RepID=A0ACB1AIV0_MELEN